MSLLGGLSPKAFLREHWQKRPLLVRQAMPGFTGLLDREQLLSLALRPDATSRLVLEHPRRRARWERHDGPFGGPLAELLPPSHWTLLVHGLESVVPGAWELLRAFSFIPQARIDDLMVSYAANGGSVGPHVDRYDVFLLQGPGRRRWQINTRGDRTLDHTAAIKVLRNFVPEEEWLLEPGDMLYLPPGVAHYGVAEGPCFTYSVGFLAPTHQELVQSFLGYLGNTLPIDPDALYADPDLTAPRDPLAVEDAMVGKVERMLGMVRWDRATVAEFLGCFLTRPKPQVRFTPPARALAYEAFERRLRDKGRLVLALASRGLVRRQRVYLNGTAYVAGAQMQRDFAALVRERSLQLPLRRDERFTSLLFDAYRAGHVLFAR